MPSLPHRSLLLLSLLAACGEGRAGEPHQLQPAAADGNLVLLVSNHSTKVDPLDIGVTIDGEAAVAGDFPTGKDYMFRFHLALGGHSLAVDSIDIDTTRLITFGVGEGVSYGVLQYSDESSEEPSVVPLFTWEFLDEPPAFELGPI